MTVVSLVNTLFALGTVFGQGLLAIMGLAFLLSGEKSAVLFAPLKKHGLLLAFLVAGLASLGSLFYSEVAGFSPCELCWFQRIFMYSTAVLLLLALVRKDRQVTFYPLFLAGIGFFISLYHNGVSYGVVSSACSIAKDSLCLKRYVFEFGYVDIPMMTLTAFALVVVFLALSRAKS